MAAGSVPTDDELLAGILAAPDLRALHDRILAFYRDADRADRTSREMLYLHLGLLSGALDSAIVELQRACAAAPSPPPGASAATRTRPAARRPRVRSTRSPNPKTRDQ